MLAQGIFHIYVHQQAAGEDHKDTDHQDEPVV